MLKVNQQTQPRKAGFTIVEMLIIAPIVILTIGAFITAIVSMTGEVLATRSSNVLAYSIQDALGRIEEDVKLSTTFLAKSSSLSISPTNQTGQGYDDIISDFKSHGLNGDMLVLNTLVTTANPLTSSSGLVYLKDQPNACASAQVSQNIPMTMNVVYFIKDSKLWRRSIMPADYQTAGCTATPWQQPSCKVIGGFCKSRDILLIDGIDSSEFVIQYFNKANDTAATAAADNSDDEVRRLALESQTTVGATINVTKTAAGREISQSGTLRATKLDINASSIAQISPDTVPAKPTVTASFVGPSSAKFSWPQVPGATAYAVTYSIAGGGYVSAGPDTTNTSYTVAAARTQSVCATVYAKNSAGTSPFGSACIFIPAWNALVMENSWTDYNNGYATAAYTKTTAGVVVLKGLIRKTNTPTPGEVIGTLPPGYRPSEAIMFGTSSADTTSRVDIYNDGRIIYSTGSPGWVSLEGISFIPSATSYTWNALPLVNGWSWYGGGWATPAYTRDSEGRVFTKGLIAGGGTAQNAVFATPPGGYRPSEYLHMPTTSNNVFDLVGIDPTTGLQTKSLALNGYRSIQQRYYAAGYPATWNNLTLNAASLWVVYPGYATPQYTKGSDGIVTVKGLIKNGTVASGTVIATLPPGYRPRETILLNGACNLAYCRIDVFPNGDIVARAGMSAIWSALEGITFIAEQ